MGIDSISECLHGSKDARDLPYAYDKVSDSDQRSQWLTGSLSWILVVATGCPQEGYPQIPYHAQTTPSKLQFDPTGLDRHVCMEDKLCNQEQV